MDRETTKLALELLNAIRTDLGATRDDMREIKRTLTSLETSVASLSVAMRDVRAS